MLTKAWRTYQGTMEALTHPVNLQQPKYFFAIPFSQSKLLYDINLNAAQVYEDRIARARSVHFWNYVVDQNALMKSLNKNDTRLFAYVIRKHCRPVFDFFVQ